jgi:hypothetical protein
MQESKKIFDFKTQMNLGDKGEQDFLKFYKDAVKHPTREHDFDLDGKKIELKTDNYTFKDTDNFFIKDGSVWQSAHCDYFVYYFINEGIFFWFDMTKFREFLEEHIKDKSYVLIRNKGWTALGYKVNRELCKDFIIKQDNFIKE